MNAVNKDVSRAEGKLAGAVRAFSYDFRGKVVLDIGSSTGGFTELALKHGAKKVVAVEKGTRQMKAPLRFDPRVELHEKTDILATKLANFASCSISRPSLRGEMSRQGSNPASLTKLANFIAFGTILADVSFTSLKPILAHARKYLADGHTEFLVMLKPQFEARPEQLVRGVVKNEKMRRGIIKDFEIWLKQNGFVIVNKRDNEVVGKNGNQERFYFLKLQKKQKIN